MDSRLAYYKLQFNDNSKNLANEYKLDYQYADQYMTEDIAKFSQTLTSLFTSVGKPFMDLIFFSFYLRDNLGTAGIMGIFANYFITGLFLRMKSPKFSKMLKTRSSLEGIFYNYNLSLINNCEEISFYQGIKLEKEKLTSIFKRLTRQITKEIHARLFYGFWEDYILKYTWSALGYLYAAIPIFFSTAVRDGGEFTNMKQFIINKRLMLSLADAGSRLMYSIKDISRLSGYTDRVFDLLLNLHQVHDLNFQYGFTPETIGGSWSASVAKLNHLSNDEGKVCTALTHGVNGTVQLNYPGIRFERIPIVIPSSLGSRGTHLVDNVNIRIKRYDSLLILGNNGSGKSSILRVLSQIWPLYDGLLSRPRDNEIMFVSQRSYFLNNGTLRDQITYPLSFVEVSEMGFSDDHLVMCLKEAGLGYLFDRFGRDLNFSPTGESLKATEETNSNGTSTQGVGNAWFNLLSGGERQKMIIARVLFHNKPYVVLDEPTNAVSFDMEDVLFEVLLKRNFTLVTISHRPILMKYHDYCLEIREDGKYEVQELGNRRPRSRKLLADGTVSRQDSDSYAIVVEKEIKELEKDLARMEDLEVKRTELKRYLDGEE